jgi:hypothetical protein
MLLIKLAGKAGNAELCTAVLNIYWLENYRIARSPECRETVSLYGDYAGEL